MWNLEGMQVWGTYLDLVEVSGRVTLSRVAYGGGVEHHVKIDEGFTRVLTLPGPGPGNSGLPRVTTPDVISEHCGIAKTPVQGKTGADHTHAVNRIKQCLCTAVKHTTVYSPDGHKITTSLLRTTAL